jgi:SRSO17 transposase
MQMDTATFERVADSFAVFHHTFAPYFGRKEAQRRSEHYLRGLLVQHSDRRNAENLAEAIPGATPRALQRFLTEAPWSIDPVITALQRFLAERLSTPEGVFVIDESGFPKQGSHSVGVAPQYCGALGKVANCQMGVFLAYVSSCGHALIDARLFLPRVWAEDRERCQQAGVPKSVSYASKAELGLTLLREARKRGHLEGQWVTADEWYGRGGEFRDELDKDHWRYVLQVPLDLEVFVQPAVLEEAQARRRGRKRRRPRLAEGSPRPVAVGKLLKEWAAAGWTTLTVDEGAQGPLTYQFAVRRVWESREGLPGRESWLLLRRNQDGSEGRCYLSNAPAETSLWRLGWVSSHRWAVETELKTGKGEVGLDEYEVRSWRGWHHHMVLGLLAGAFLLMMEQEWGKKDAAGDAAAGEPAAAGAVAAAAVEPGGLAGVDAGYAAAQRARQTFPSQAPAC